MITEEQKDHLRLWVSALRKTKSKQAKGFLCRLDENQHIVGYCCLGIACNVYKKETGKGIWNKLTENAIFIVGNTYKATNLPYSIMKYYGISKTDDNYIMMND
jgi:hypothetical protein